jgi:hypothetical protein
MATSLTPFMITIYSCTVANFQLQSIVCIALSPFHTQYTIHCMHWILCLLSHTSPLVPPSNGRCYPPWVPRLSQHHGHSDSWLTVHSPTAFSCSNLSCLELFQYLLLTQCSVQELPTQSSIQQILKYCHQVKVKVILWPMVSWSVCPGIKATIWNLSPIFLSHQ